MTRLRNLSDLPSWVLQRDDSYWIIRGLSTRMLSHILEILKKPFIVMIQTDSEYDFIGYDNNKNLISDLEDLAADDGSSNIICIYDTINNKYLDYSIEIVVKLN